MVQSRIPGPIGLDGMLSEAGPHHQSGVKGLDIPATKGGATPGGLGRTLWQKQSGLPASPPPIKSSSPSALIVIGTGHDHIKKGVRFKSDDYFDKAAQTTFAPHLTGAKVTIKHVSSAREMKDVIAGGTWDVVIYFGHGVENAKALAPNETGPHLKEEELVSALKAAKAKRVVLAGCKSAATGLARALSKQLPGTNVYGNAEGLDASWLQKMDTEGNFTNEFQFVQQFSRYNGGFQVDVKTGAKLARRLVERGDPIVNDPTASSLDEPTVPQ
jgi:hypothetical protein